MNAITCCFKIYPLSSQHFFIAFAKPAKWILFCKVLSGNPQFLLLKANTWSRFRKRWWSICINRWGWCILHAIANLYVVIATRWIQLREAWKSWLRQSTSCKMSLLSSEVSKVLESLCHRLRWLVHRVLVNQVFWKHWLESKDIKKLLLYNKE